MPDVQQIQVVCRSIDQAHFNFIRELFQRGRTYVNLRGSYEGHQRLEFGFINLHLTHPGEDTVPILPQGVPAMSTLEGNEKYFLDKLMNPDPEPNEQYTYGRFIAPQLPKIVKMLRDTPDTNQAVICIGNEHSVDQEHPPCLRLIDFRVQGDRLHMFVYFRSWDLWGGLPENLGGLRHLQEYVATEIDRDAGELLAASKGLHLYDMAWPVALMRLADNMPDNSVITRKQAELGEGWMSVCAACGESIAEGEGHRATRLNPETGQDEYVMYCNAHKEP